MSDTTQAACLVCYGECEVLSVRGFGSEACGEYIDCEHCSGTGECECDDCVNTAAENAFSDMCESEPPVSMAECHQTAWNEKQALRAHPLS